MTDKTLTVAGESGFDTRTSADPSPLHLLEVLEPGGGGSGRHFIDLCSGLAQRGHRVTAVYSPLRAEPRFLDELKAMPVARLLPLPMRRAVGPWDVSALIALKRLARREGPFDLIHGHSSKAGALTRLLPARGAPVLYTPHAFRTMDPGLGAKGRLLFGTVERLLGRWCSDRIICVSPDEQAHALALGIPADRLRLVINGVATPPSDGRAAMRAELGLSETALVFGFIGRFAPQKAPERLIEAFAAVAPALPEAHLVMIGSGELEAELRRRIASLGLESRVHLQGKTPGHIAIQTFDVLVSSSRYEAMSYVALEAAAAGLPLLLTEVGGASVVLEHDVNGLMIANSDDPTGLIGALTAFADPDTRNRFAAAALARRHQYRLEVMVDNTLAVYRDVLSAGKRPVFVNGPTVESTNAGRGIKALN